VPKRRTVEQRLVDFCAERFHQATRKQTTRFSAHLTWSRISRSIGFRLLAGNARSPFPKHDRKNGGGDGNENDGGIAGPVRAKHTEGQDHGGGRPYFPSVTFALTMNLCIKERPPARQTRCPNQVAGSKAPGGHVTPVDIVSRTGSAFAGRRPDPSCRYPAGTGYCHSCIRSRERVHHPMP